MRLLKFLAVLALAAIPALAQQQPFPGGSSSMTTLTGMVSCLDVVPACVSDNSALDASTTNTSNIVTCPNSDCHFLTTAAIGQIVQAGTLAAGIVLNTTTIQSVDSDTQIHTVGSAIGTSVGTAYLAWGPDNTASMDALHNASIKVCKYAFLPAGFYFTQHADFNHQNANCANQAAGRVGGVIGAGPGWINSKLLMRYDFQFTTGGPSGGGCDGGSGNACFGGPIALDFRAFSVDMMFNPAVPGSTKYIVECNACYFDRVGVSGAQGSQAATSNVVMMHFVGDEGVARESAAVGGIYACLNDGRLTQLTLSPCIDAGVVGLFGNSGSFFSKGNFINANGGNCAASGSACATYCASGAFCHHENDSFNGGSLINAGTSYYNHIYTNVGGSSTPLTNQSGGVIVIRDTTTPITFNNNSGGTVIDGCGNNFSGAFTQSGVWQGDCSLGGLPIVQVATNITPSTGWGTTGAAGNGVSAVSGLSVNENFTITAAGVPTANPTIAVVFPHNFVTPPIYCVAIQTGGTGAIQPLTVSVLPTATGVTFKWNGTPVAGSTYIISTECSNR